MKYTNSNFKINQFLNGQQSFSEVYTYKLFTKTMRKLVFT